MQTMLAALVLGVSPPADVAEITGRVVEIHHSDQSAKMKEPASKGKTAADEGKADYKEEDKKEDKEEEEKPEPLNKVTGQVTLVSDYRFRGISQTMRRPAIQGNIDYSNIWGFYAGTFGSNVDGTTHFYNNTSMEWDFYGGYRNSIPWTCSDFTYDIGAIYYYYPGGKAFVDPTVRYNTAELYLQLGYKWFSVKVSESLTNYFGICGDNPPFNWRTDASDGPNGSSRGSTYVEGNISWDVYEQVLWWKCYPYCFKGGKLNLQLHAGHQWVRHYRHLDYTDWRVTATQELEWFSVFLSYVGTNGRHAYYNVPDNGFHRKIRHLGCNELLGGITRSF